MDQTGSSKRMATRRWAGLLLLPLLSGCAFGPRLLENSHVRYQEAVKRVEDEELLRNLVRLRYTESFSNLDVASITAQYELAGGAEARPFFLAPNPADNGVFRNFTSVLPGATLSGANRPTISLVPDHSPETVRRLLSPVTPEGVHFFVESGWPVSTVFRLGLDSANAVSNARAARGAGPSRSRIPEYIRFRRVTDLLRSLEERGEVTFAVEVRKTPQGYPLPAEKLTAEAQVEASKNGLEYVTGPEPRTCVLARRERKFVLKVHPMALAGPEYLELCDLLWLRPGLTEYDVTVGALPPFPGTFPPERLAAIDVAPRSTVQALSYMSHGVAVPAEHAAEGIARSTAGPDDRVFDWREVTAGLFSVCSVRQHHRPEHAYVAVEYRDHWFYIDDRDHASKATFNLMLQLARLDLSGDGTRSRQGSPLLTLPVGR